MIKYMLRVTAASRSSTMTFIFHIIKLEFENSIQVNAKFLTRMANKDVLTKAT
jgi:ribosomal protein L20